MHNVDREGRKDIAAKISLLAVRDWCVQRRVNLSKFCKELSKLGILLSPAESGSLWVRERRLLRLGARFPV